LAACVVGGNLWFSVNSVRGRFCFWLKNKTVFFFFAFFFPFGEWTTTATARLFSAVFYHSSPFLFPS